MCKDWAFLPSGCSTWQYIDRDQVLDLVTWDIQSIHEVPNFFEEIHVRKEMIQKLYDGDITRISNQMGAIYYDPNRKKEIEECRKITNSPSC